MDTIYDVGDEVLVKGTVDRITVTKDGIEYFVKLKSNPGNAATDVKTTDIYGRVLTPQRRVKNNRACYNCKHGYLSWSESPCNGCDKIIYSKWEER